jgi:DNA-3-methyladenine glycosylase
VTSEDARDFLSKPSPEVAPRLLGWILSHRTAEGTVTVELTELEAYAGMTDPASHAYRGPTRRNAVMFGPAGHLYVYRSHGIHWCCNVVTGPEGDASAVLLRAGRVIQGNTLARLRRGERVADRSLARGPGCLGQALGLSGEHDGSDLLGSGGLTLTPSTTPATGLVSTGPRVGISRASEVPWRYWLTDDRTVSSYRRSNRAALTSCRQPATT